MLHLKYIIHKENSKGTSSPSAVYFLGAPMPSLYAVGAYLKRGTNAAPQDGFSRLLHRPS